MNTALNVPDSCLHQVCYSFAQWGPSLLSTVINEKFMWPEHIWSSHCSTTSDIPSVNLSLCFFQPISPTQSGPTCKTQGAHWQGCHGSPPNGPWRGASICRPHPLHYGNATHLSPLLPQGASRLSVPLIVSAICQVGN